MTKFVRVFGSEASKWCVHC